MQSAVRHKIAETLRESGSLNIVLIMFTPLPMTMQVEKILS